MIVIGSLNADKIREIKAFEAAEGLELTGIGDYGDVPDVEENGATFEDNASIKAVEHSKWLLVKHGIDPLVVAEDAGLCVHSLDDWPGVLSARIAPDNPSRNQVVLERLGDSPDRDAQFVAVTALAHRGRLIGTWRGTVDGRITNEERGTGGFGYDPIFEIVELGKTFGELGTKIKNTMSHRTRGWTMVLNHIKENQLDTP